MATWPPSVLVSRPTLAQLQGKPDEGPRANCPQNTRRVCFPRFSTHLFEARKSKNFVSYINKQDTHKALEFVLAKGPRNPSKALKFGQSLGPGVRRFNTRFCRVLFLSLGLPRSPSGHLPSLTLLSALSTGEKNNKVMWA